MQVRLLDMNFKFLKPNINCQTLARKFGISSKKFQKENFIRGSSINVNLATIGDAGHGKTTLNANLTKVASKTPKPVEEFERGSSGLGSSRPTHFEWFRDADNLRFSHTDVPGSPEYIKNTLAHFFQMNGGLLVISASKGVTETTRNHYRLLKHASGIGKCPIVPVLNFDATSDAENEELKELAIEEMKDFVADAELEHLICGPVNDFAVVENVSERLANLFSADQLTHDRKDSCQAPLLWPLENVGNIPTRGTFLAGRVQSGSLHKGDKINILQNGRTIPAVIRELEVFQRLTPDLMTGDRGGAFVRLKTDVDIKRGAVVINGQGQYPDKEHALSKRWDISVKQIVTKKEAEEYKGHLSLHFMTHHEGIAQIGQVELKPGEEKLVKLEIKFPILAKPADPIILRCGSRFLIGNIQQKSS